MKYAFPFNKLFYIVGLLFIGFSLSAHQTNYEKLLLKQWNLTSGKSIGGSFSMVKNNIVYIETENNQLVKVPFSSLSADDQQLVLSKDKHISELNSSLYQFQSSTRTNAIPYWKFVIVFLTIGLLGMLIFYKRTSLKTPYLLPILYTAIGIALFSFTTKVLKKTATITSPSFVESAFAPFKPAVNTRYDSTYFYVESLGLVDHPMMSGITSWQQQVPISQCYIGANAWSIPLNPVVATTPVPVNQNHFLRGAVAIASNGISIFNPYTNTGVDAYLDGQLDYYGGHCGRADDYHYHIAPMHLDSITSAILPIAFALDGYAVYAGFEPDGTTMKTLDSNHGHYDNSGVYHYHGTKSAPYMIGNMVGKVTEDTTMQIIPQASAKPIRPAGTPLNGAAITACIPNGLGTGYNLVYTLAGVTDSVSYNWTQAGNYTFNFYVSGNKTTSNYTGSAICKVPVSTGISTIDLLKESFNIYPNPSHDILYIECLKLENSSPTLIRIYNLNGDLIKQVNYQHKIDISDLSKGTYLIQLNYPQISVVKKLLVQ